MRSKLAKRAPSFYSLRISRPQAVHIEWKLPCGPERDQVLAGLASPARTVIPRAAPFDPQSTRPLVLFVAKYDLVILCLRCKGARPLQAWQDLLLVCRLAGRRKVHCGQVVGQGGGEHICCDGLGSKVFEAEQAEYMVRLPGPHQLLPQVRMHRQRELEQPHVPPREEVLEVRDQHLKWEALDAQNGEPLLCVNLRPPDLTEHRFAQLAVPLL
mmetsp:Transcript_8623/g.15368  ORF Transcript_8623/g.15368 Transcript_8623/m.15368 type:complete len:213 (-) Transcript_8623:51-689(-)